ncbi:M15 family metallopeptidase [Kineosporia sp. R_H_3]|uniref:M15 family metallopeptidase n=1 Tax=Kineosporia sp. R_H_3 TaxID=1961848 RepID=UPI000B4BF565|nr:M15 family metallopeptidase [Kineosporia sp. R_H_3]
MPSHRAETPTPRRRTDRPDISQRRQARATAPVEPGYDPRVEAAPQYATLAPAGLLEDRPAADAYDVYDPAPFSGFESFETGGLDLGGPGYHGAPHHDAGQHETEQYDTQQHDTRHRTATPAPSDGYDLFGGAFASPVSAAAPASVVKGGPQQPMTRAQLRAAEGPLTNRSSRRQAEKADKAGRTRRPAPQAVSPRDAVKSGTTQTTKAPRKGRTGLSLPQVGVASALGLATIAAPLTGALSVPAVKTAAEPMPAVAAEAPSVAFPHVAAPEANAVEEAKLVPGANDGSTVPSTLAAPRTIIVTRASRDSERSVLPGCDGKIPRGETWSNGQIATKELCTLWEPKHMLRADAAVALAKLNIAYKKRFGKDICITDSYRTLSEQRHLKAIKPGLAAAPGTSNHGWGVATDLCGRIEDYGSATYRWMRANAPAYGWENPDWALPGGSGPFEPWHWEYMPGEKVGPGSD